MENTQISLFNGKNMDGWHARGGASEHAWSAIGDVALNPDDNKLLTATAGEGIFYNGPTGRTTDLYTEYEHGDCELHVEFMVPQGSNSGVYVMGRYEIQILDSWGATELHYGTCGGVYCRWIDNKPVDGVPPRVNASKPPGEWQTYDITFRAPKFDINNSKTANAIFVKVVWNGQIVHEDVEVVGVTRGAMLADEATTGPLLLQGDHGPVAYRNVVLTPIDD
ncbi:hypothetical protein C6501_07680 [Candidatus Poribacteria bacterium]|nr:MAG: hypothetical protein C6501_07680 [Candidatus Poribacteria bacterium]